MNFRPIPPNEVGRSIYTGARIRIRLLNRRPLPHVLAGNGGLQLWARAGSCLHQAWRPQPPLLISPWGNLSCARLTRPKSEASPEPSCATHPPGHRAKTWRLKPSPRSHLTDLPAHLQDVTSYPNIGSRGWGHAMASLIEHAHTHTHRAPPSASIQHTRAFRDYIAVARCNMKVMGWPTMGRAVAS